MRLFGVGDGDGGPYNDVGCPKLPCALGVKNLRLTNALAFL